MSDTGSWIRDAELNDAPELAALMCELGYETGHRSHSSAKRSASRARAYGWKLENNLVPD
jgi:hypothetical protein